jgi:hypothetical protein
VEAELLLATRGRVRPIGAVSTLDMMPTRVSICATACTIFSSLT